MRIWHFPGQKFSEKYQTTSLGKKCDVDNRPDLFFGNLHSPIGDFWWVGIFRQKVTLCYIGYVTTFLLYSHLLAGDFGNSVILCPMWSTEKTTTWPYKHAFSELEKRPYNRSNAEENLLRKSFFVWPYSHPL